MKRIVSLIVFTFLVLSCYQLVGQDFTFGAGGGIIIPSLVGGGSDNPTKAGNTFSIGNDFGVYGEYKIIDSYSCSVGLDYSSQGGLYKLKYLLVPFLVRQTWILEKHSKFYLGAGPFAGFLLSCNRTINPGMVNHPNDFNVGIGAIAGISHNFNYRGAFFIEVGIDYGFIRLQKPITQSKGHMFIEMIKIGYSYSLFPGSHKKYCPRRWQNN